MPYKMIASSTLIAALLTCLQRKGRGRLIRMDSIVVTMEFSGLCEAPVTALETTCCPGVGSYVASEVDLLASWAMGAQSEHVRELST